MPTKRTTAKPAKPPISEAAFQQSIIKWLRSKKCVVIKNQQNATTKIGVADLVFFLEGFYGFIEVKKSKTARLQVGQKEFIEKMNDWSWAKIVYPENWEETKTELEEILR